MPLLWQRTPPDGFARLKRWVLSTALSALDRRFEQQFRALLNHSLPQYQTPRQRPLLIASIGTLGPGGSERQLVNTLLGIKARYDIDIEVVAMSLKEASERFFVDTLTTARISVSEIDRHSGLIIPGDVPEHEAQRLRAAVRAHLHPDLDHVSAYATVFLARRPEIVHLWLDTVNTTAGLAAVLAGVPRIVLGTRAMNPSHFAMYQPYMRAAYRCLLDVPRVVPLNNSETGARDYATWLGVDATRIAVLRNGLDVDAAAAHVSAAAGEYRARWSIPASAPVLGGLMRLSEEKRPLLWVEVAELVAARCPDVHFLLVGEGVLRPLVDTRVAASRFAHRFHLVGAQQNAYDSLSVMNLLFLSSRLEGSPNVLLEAQAVGVPVVTMSAGGAVEAVDDGRSGWVVNEGTVAAAAERITYLMTHPREVTAAAAAGPDWVRERFGLDRMIRKTAAAYGGLGPITSRAS